MEKRKLVLNLEVSEAAWLYSTVSHATTWAEKTAERCSRLGTMKTESTIAAQARFGNYVLGSIREVFNSIELAQSIHGNIEAFAAELLENLRQ